MSKHLILFSMKGCPYCNEIKETFKKEEISFFDCDIETHKEEYDLFVEVTGNDLVPAFMIVDEQEKDKPEFFAPDRDFETLDEALILVKKKI